MDALIGMYSSDQYDDDYDDYDDEDDDDDDDRFIYLFVTLNY